MKSYQPRLQGVSYERLRYLLSHWTLKRDHARDLMYRAGRITDERRERGLDIGDGAASALGETHAMYHQAQRQVTRILEAMAKW